MKSLNSSSTYGSTLFGSFGPGMMTRRWQKSLLLRKTYGKSAHLHSTQHIREIACVNTVYMEMYAKIGTYHEQVRIGNLAAAWQEAVIPACFRPIFWKTRLIAMYPELHWREWKGCPQSMPRSYTDADLPAIVRMLPVASSKRLNSGECQKSCAMPGGMASRLSAGRAVPRKLHHTGSVNIRSRSMFARPKYQKRCFGLYITPLVRRTYTHEDCLP